MFVHHEEQLLVFPINLDLQNKEPLAKIIGSQFNVTQFPTIIVDDVKYEGVVDKEKMEEIICDSVEQAAPCQP